ncbi:MAG TPA: hypothetical protein VGW78_07470 [Candidatus Babeliales bacterium]|jgi:hypothetical protein|nr:hypothetical protein [Candidatus Babeliales bacterium]
MPIVPAGSVNLSSIGVPNVYVQIIPPNPLLNGVPTNIVGVVGSASWGPVNSPTVIGSLQQLIANFGNPVARTYDLGTPVYAAMQQGANSFKCVRVTDGTDTAASSQLLDSTTALGATLTSIYTGSYPNSSSSSNAGCYATLAQGSTSSTWKLSIYFANGIPEVFDNIGGSGAQFWSNLVNAVNLGQNALRGPSQLCTAATANTISSVTVATAGSYATLPTLGTSGPGSGATLNATMKAVSAVVVAAGTGYAPADTITLTGGSHTVNAILNVATTKLVSVAVNAGGSNYLVGDTITLAGGTFSSAAVLTVSTVSGGAVTGVTISSAGSYTANSTSFTQGSTSGVGSGATFNTGVFGVNTATVNTVGAYTALPSSPVSQGSTSGSGSGATFTVLWGLLSVQVAAAGSGYTTSSQFVVSGGGGTGGATGTLVLGSAALPSSTSTVYYFSGGADGASNVGSSQMIGSDTATPRSGMYALRNSQASIAMLADLSDATSFTTQLTFGNSEGIYIVAVEASGNQNNVANMVSILQGAAAQGYNLKVMGGDWVYFNDPFNNVTRLISPQGYVCGVLSVTPAFGSSLNKQMNAIVGTQKSQEQQLYSDADLYSLITAGVDLITRPIPLSPNAFGVRLGVNTSNSAVTKFDNYPRMVNYLAQTMVAGMGQFIGQPQTPDVQRQARDTLNVFLSNLQQLGWIGTLDGSPAFSVILDSSNNPQNRVALGFMRADIQVVLFSIVQQLVINLQAGSNVSIQVLPPQLLAGQ